MTVFPFRASVGLLAAALVSGCSLWETGPHLRLDVPIGVVLPALEVGAAPARLLVLGDQGTRDAAQFQVAAGLAKRHAAAPAQAVVLLGDNFYENGVSSVADPKWDGGFRLAYPASALAVPFYAVTGNHDYRQSAQPEYDYVDPEGRWILDSPAESLAVTIGGVPAAEIYLVDSTQVVEETLVGRRSVAWIIAAARASAAPVKILALHHAPVSHGMHGNSRLVAEAFQAEFDEGVFDLVVAGHDHDLELSTVGTVDFAVSGAGAKLRSLGTGASQVWGQSRLGFLELELNGTGYTLTFRDARAASLYTRTS